MIETWALVFIYSIKKKLNIKLIFKDWPIYLPLIMLVGYIIFEILIFNDKYWITQYSTLFKQVTLLSYITLIYYYQLYDSMDNSKSELVRFVKSPFIIATVCLLVGYLLNYIAITANSGHMPVFPSNTYFTSYTDIESFTKDSFYVLGDQNSKAIPLCDTIDIFIGNLSIGDLFVRAYPFILILNSIKRINKKEK